jgi:hypothetical protein
MHTVLAFLLFATFLAHFAAALMHALVFRDGVFQSMASLKGRTGEVARVARSDPPSAPNA